MSDDSRNTISVSEDEVKKHFSCIYISACESTWRILAFPTQYRTTLVEKLSFHMPNQQLVVYNEDDHANEILKRMYVGQTKFLAWMDANKIYPEARNLTYADFPTKFVWHLKERVWKPRRRGFTIGHVTFVPQSASEVYYLRVMINVVKGPTSFTDIRTVAGVVYNTFEEACFALGLLDDDKEYIEPIKEASWWASGKYLRQLFPIMLKKKCNAS